MSAIDDFRPTLDQVEAALRQFVLGDATAIQACWSQADDVTLLGGWGAYERSWEQVGPRLEWAAARYRGEPSPANGWRKG